MLHRMHDMRTTAIYDPGHLSVSHVTSLYGLTVVIGMETLETQGTS